MVATTTETLTANGVLLNTLAKNVESLTGRLRTPPRRGENRTVAGRHGRIYRRKFYDENTIVLPMWVQGSDDDGLVPETSTERKKLFENVEALASLFAAEEGVTLQHVLPDGSTRRISGFVQDTIDFTTDSYAMAKYSVSIVCPQPFWEALSTVTVQGAPGNISLTPMGATSAPTDDSVITFTGPCINPKITVVYGGRTLSLQYNVSLSASQSATFDCGTYGLTVTGGATRSYDSLVTAGDPRWFVVPAQTTTPASSKTVVYSQTGGSGNAGTAKIVARPRYLIG